MLHPVITTPTHYTTYPLITTPTPPLYATGHTTHTATKLGAILTALFHRLADRRAAIKGEK